MQRLFALTQRLQEPSGWSWSGSQRTFSCRQASHARGRLRSARGSLGAASAAAPAAGGLLLYCADFEPSVPTVASFEFVRESEGGGISEGEPLCEVEVAEGDEASWADAFEGGYSTSIYLEVSTAPLVFIFFSRRIIPGRLTPPSTEVRYVGGRHKNCSDRTGRTYISR